MKIDVLTVFYRWNTGLAKGITQIPPHSSIKPFSAK